MMPRILLIAVLLNVLCFFRGCTDGNALVLSVGVAVPYVQFEATNEFGIGILPSSFGEISWPALAANIAVGVFLAWFIAKRLDRRRSTWALGGVSLLSWSLAASFHVWVYIVGYPTAWIGSWMKWALYFGDMEASEAVDGRYAMSIAARLWLAVLFLAIYAAAGFFGRRRCEVRGGGDVQTAARQVERV